MRDSRFDSGFWLYEEDKRVHFRGSSKRHRNGGGNRRRQGRYLPVDGRASVKYGKGFNRDYGFYERHIGKFTYVGEDLSTPEADLTGADAKKAFHALDSNGKWIPCSEPNKLIDLLKTKKAINFHLKMWGEGFDDMRMGVFEYMQEFIDPPAWVETSFREQIRKARYSRGYDEM